LKLRVLDLFSGIGGFSLGLERTGGFETVAFCEIDPLPRRVLAKHWPRTPQYEDVCTLDAARLATDGITGIDVITGGFPCQDISIAGARRGMGEGSRSGLWAEIVRLIGELRPAFVIVENVANLLAGPSEWPGRWFGRILGDLAECGYDAEWENIPASALGAPHRRERIWVVAYPHEIGRLERQILAPVNLQKYRGTWASNSAQHIIDIGRRRRFSLPSDLCLGNGVPGWLGGYGNAVVPQIPEMIGRAILQSMKEAA